MSRPKSTMVITIKVPEELLRGIEFLCSLYPHKKTVSDWIKDAIEFRMYIAFGLRLGLYKLMKFFPELLGKTGMTSSDPGEEGNTFFEEQAQKKSGMTPHKISKKVIPFSRTRTESAS